MSKTNTHIISSVPKQYTLVGDYMMLIKMRLTSLVVFTAIAAYLIASGLDFTWMQMGLLAVGGFCVVGASNTLNQVLEKDFDNLMRRTRNRPVAAGRMSVSHAVLFAGALCLLGVTILATFNVWAAFLGMLAFVTYAFIYTPLKRHSRAAILVGAIAGAMPMAIGVVAFTNGITVLALTLFAIQFAWQYPHFWAIAYLGHQDYNQAGFRFVPMNGDLPSKSIALSSIIFTLLLVCIAAFMFLNGMISVTAGFSIAVLGFIYLFYAIGFYRSFNMVSARKLMFSSLLYIPIVMFILIIDKF